MVCIVGEGAADDPAAARLRNRRRGAAGEDDPSFLTSDKTPPENISNTTDAAKPMQVDATYGRTPSGDIFLAPPTHDFLNTLSSTLFTSTLTQLTLLTLIAQPIIYYLLGPGRTRQIFFFLEFAFWRASYDAGLGWMLRRQSERKWIVRKLRSWGILDRATTKDGGQPSAWSIWWKRELEAKLGAEGYRWEGVPDEFNAWLVFRQLVDVILLNDFLTYCLFAISHLSSPPAHSMPMHIARWLLGWSLILFNLWVKIDAHRVVRDYAWYWGDAFWLVVQRDELVFDGVYEIAPHPMYSVGYAGYYGLSIVTGSYTVLFTSVVAHAAQFAFLLWFENPHIERTYGGSRKPITERLRMPFMAQPQEEEATAAAGLVTPQATTEALPTSTPSVTDGETEEDEEEDASPATPPAVQTSSATSTSGMHKHRLSPRELATRYLQKPAVVFANLDLFRATDLCFVLLVSYAVLPALVPARIAYSSSSSLHVIAHVLHALAWRLFHSFGLGLLLRAQSRSKWLVRHFLKHYRYAHISGLGADASDDDVVERATQDAFANWRVIYNVSLVMTYVSFVCLAWKIYSIPSDWTVSGLLLRHVLGVALIALHIWAAVSSYEVLGDFGWLYSDFFLLEQYQSQLAYTGIYRFLNNPERSMGGAAFFGLALISGSWTVASLAIISHLSHWWFLSCVEGPHMQKLYGDRLRKDGGLTKTVKNVVGKHARALESRAGRHAPEIKRRISEVRGTIDKVEERVTEAVEEFLQHARPRLSGVVQDTKFLLQQSRERMIITRVASDISAYDSSQYSMTIPSSSSRSTASNRFQVGQPIRVFWNAPANHSRKDWIGIYRLGSCRSELVTRVSSVGKWRPLYDEEWNGDEPLQDVVPRQRPDVDAGVVTFDRNTLPRTPGQYELRLHHDGKHNVMTKLAPIEIFVNKVPASADHRTVHDEVATAVALSVDLDVNLAPRCSFPLTEEIRVELEDPELVKEPTRHVEDNDEFELMDEEQAKRVVHLLGLKFGVELAPDVIIADANIESITRRVLGARSLQRTSTADRAVD